MASIPFKVLSFFTYATFICYFLTGKQHSNDFSRLIAQVRGRLETTRQTHIKQEVIAEGKDTQKTPSAGIATLITFVKE